MTTTIDGPHCAIYGMDLESSGEERKLVVMLFSWISLLALFEMLNRFCGRVSRSRAVVTAVGSAESAGGKEARTKPRRFLCGDGGMYLHKAISSREGEKKKRSGEYGAKKKTKDMEGYIRSISKSIGDEKGGQYWT